MTIETVTITLDAATIAALEALGFVRAEPEVVGRFKPRKNEQYFVYSPSGPFPSPWDGGDIDKNRYELGLVFKTIDEAQKSFSATKALVRVQDKLEELTVVPLDWGNEGQDKYYIFFSHKKHKLMIGLANSCQSISALYGSQAACNWVINNMESDLALLV